MWQHLKRALEEFAQIKLKSMFMPRGCRVLHLKIRRPSALRLSLVLPKPCCYRIWKTREQKNRSLLLYQNSLRISCCFLYLEEWGFNWFNRFKKKKTALTPCSILTNREKKSLRHVVVVAKFLCCAHLLDKAGEWNQEVSCCSCATTAIRNVPKSVMNVRSCSIANLNLLLFCCCKNSLLLWFC